MTLDDLMKHHDEDMALYSAVSQYTDVMDRVRFGQFCCIIMELYCKFNDEDVV